MEVSKVFIKSPGFLERFLIKTISKYCKVIFKYKGIDVYVYGYLMKNSSIVVMSISLNDVDYFPIDGCDILSKEECTFFKELFEDTILEYME